MTFKFELTVNVNIVGMHELIEAVRGAPSADDIVLLNSLLEGAGRIARRLASLDAARPQK